LPGFYVKHNYFEFKQAFEGLVTHTKYLPIVSSFSSQGASDTGHLLISKLSIRFQRTPGDVLGI
jgi:hypothetical protein